MIARSAFAQLRHSTLLLAGTMAGLLLTYIAPPALMFSGDRWATAFGLSAWLGSAILYSPTVRLYRARFWMAACLPVIAVFYLTATVESAVRYWSGVGGAWKGRIQDKGS